VTDEPAGSDRPGVDSGPADGPGTGPGPRWGLADAAVGYVVGFFVSALAASAWTLGSGSDRVGLAATSAGLVGLWVGLGGAPLFATLTKGARSLRRDFGLQVRVWDAPVGVAIGLGSQLALVPLLYLPFRLVNPNLDRQLGQPARHLTALARGPGVAVLAVLVVVGAPLVEEVFFRGLLLRSLGRRFGQAWAVVGSAVLFGLAHYEPLQLLALVAFGVVLGVLAVRTGRLGPGIFAHAAFNAVTVAVLVASR